MKILCVALLLYISQCKGIRNEGNINSTGIFERFVRDYLQILSHGCYGRKLKHYCNIVYKELDKVHYKYAVKIGQVFKSWSKGYTDEIQADAKTYLKQLDAKGPHGIEFSKAMDEVFRVIHALQFQYYIDDLKEYCNELKLFIKDETHKLIFELILGEIEKLSHKKQYELQRKAKKACKEYKRKEFKELLIEYNIPTIGPLSFDG